MSTLEKFKAKYTFRDAVKNNSLCCVMCCYVMLCYVVSCYVRLRLLCEVMICYVMLCYAMPK